MWVDSYGILIHMDMYNGPGQHGFKLVGYNSPSTYFVPKTMSITTKAQLPFHSFKKQIPYNYDTWAIKYKCEISRLHILTRSIHLCILLKKSSSIAILNGHIF